MKEDQTINIVVLLFFTCCMVTLNGEIVQAASSSQIQETIGMIGVCIDITKYHCSWKCCQVCTKIIPHSALLCPDKCWLVYN